MIDKTNRKPYHKLSISFYRNNTMFSTPSSFATNDAFNKVGVSVSVASISIICSIIIIA